MVRPDIFENYIGNYFFALLLYKSIESRMGGTEQSHQKPDDPD